MEQTETHEASFGEWLKRYWPVLILLLLVCYGFTLRSYHIDLEPIGYHNMKENQYLSQAYHMRESGDLLKPSVFWKGADEEGHWQELLPILPWVITALWGFFGENIVVARLIIVSCSLLNVLLIYMLAKRLSKNTILALLSAVFMTIMPLNVFFGRNVQPDIPGVTAILAFSIFFFKWLDEDLSRRNFVWFSIFFALAVHLKIPNGIALLPLLVFVPYKKIFEKWKSYVPEAAIFGGLALTVPLWQFLMTKVLLPDATGVFNKIRLDKLFEVFSSWNILKAFISDNYSLILFYVALVGLFFCILKYKTDYAKYCLGFALGAIPFALILNIYVLQHSYYQSPFLPLVCLLCAYFVFFIGSTCASFVKGSVPSKWKEYVTPLVAVIVLCILLFFAYPSVEKSINRQYDTLFFGVDVAGNYIQEHAGPDDRVFLGPDPSGQTLSVLWSAKRFGAWIPKTVGEFVQREQELNFRWIFLYQGGFAGLQKKPEVLQYIMENYEIKQAGGFIDGNSFSIRYYILAPGAGVDETAFQQSAEPRRSRMYDTTRGEQEFYVLEPRS